LLLLVDIFGKIIKFYEVYNIAVIAIISELLIKEYNQDRNNKDIVGINDSKSENLQYLRRSSSSATRFVPWMESECPFKNST